MVIIYQFKCCNGLHAGLPKSFLLLATIREEKQQLLSIQISCDIKVYQIASVIGSLSLSNNQ